MKKFTPINLVFLMLCSTLSFAQRAPLKSGEAPKLSNLIRESESLSILKEEGVQVDATEIKRQYALKAGISGSSQIQMNGESQGYSYDLSHKTPVIGASFAILPWRGFLELGFDFGLNYLTQEGVGLSDSEAAQLHVVTLAPSLIFQKNLMTYFTPRLGVGYGVAGIFQRGFADENTSSALGFGFGLMALDLNLSRMKWLKGDLDWALTLEHRRNFNAASEVGLGEIEKTTLGVTLIL